MLNPLCHFYQGTLFVVMISGPLKAEVVVMLNTKP